LFLLLAGVAACDDLPRDPPTQHDTGTPDVTKGGEGGPSEAGDAGDGATADTQDGSACECTLADAQASPIPGTIAGAASLACFCNERDCPTYDVALTRCPFLSGGSNRLVLNTYAACDLVSVERHWGLDTSIWVYKASTHELVGTYHETDTNSIACDATRVVALQAGAFPPASCEVESTTLACANDGGAGQDVEAGSPDAVPPNDADASTSPDSDGSSRDDADATTTPDGDGPTCACAMSDAPRPGPFPPNPGLTSLACFCNERGCPAYDVAITQCPTPFDGSNNQLRLNNYAACDLVSVERHWGFDTSVYVYKASTREMVGAYHETDTNNIACGTTRVFALEAGVFPAANCGVTSTALCVADAGSDGT
jgi:hypothetical protein